jgi:uncharacterized protein YjbI with pentapeptide repeats
MSPVAALRGSKLFRARASLSLVGLVLLLVLPSPALAAVSSFGGCAIGPGTQCPGTNLSGADLSGADLRNANLRGANLHLANLDGANLEGSDLSGADLSFAVGRKADLDRVLLGKANLSGALLESSTFYGSQLNEVSLAFAHLKGASMRHVNFVGSNLSFAILGQADLYGANFHGAILTFASFVAADIRHANFAHAHFHLTQMYAAKAWPTTLWPSNFDSDPFAVSGLFRHLVVHVNSYSQTSNCGSAEWSSPLAFCYADGENTGSAGSLRGWVGVSWCNHSLASACLYGAHANLKLPSGYDRWMKFCNLQGNSECQDYLLGAVKMPNGPFAVMAGQFEGRSVVPDDTNSARVERPGGPLFLWVGFHSSISNGGGKPASNGYVFGLRGYLAFHSP